MNEGERCMDLLAARATEGLSGTDTRELEALLAGRPELDADAFDRAAAALDLAFQAEEPATEPLPAAVRRAVIDAAGDHLPAPAGVSPFPSEDRRRTAASGTSKLGWYAAAAMLALAIWSPWSDRGPIGTSVAPAEAAERRARLIAEAPDLIRAAWNPPEIEAYAGVRGDVVWSNARQDGYMRLVGLPSNVSEREQYQLWIVDPARDARPIDGGVFDVPPVGGEIIVPIDAKLRVLDPQAFAITLEKPGGVVVSDGPLLVVAPVAT